MQYRGREINYKNVKDYIVGELFVPIGYSARKFCRYLIPDSIIRQEINFYPHAPGQHYIIWRICSVLGVKLRNHAFNKGINVYWIDGTLRPVIDDDVINGQCNDISKKKVAAVHSKVFGYSMDIDPLTYGEDIVVKNNLNAKHDGRILKGPIKDINDNYVYQKKINNNVSDNLIEDIRIPIISRNIPFVYIKRRPVVTRFSNTNAIAFLVNTDEVLSENEKYLTLKFSEEIGLDLGEIDAIRDRDTGNIYLIDVNNTPYGPPNHIDPISYNRAIYLYCIEVLKLLQNNPL
jgi:hypothetical protein